MLSRLAEPATSELAALWHEGRQGPQLDAALRDLGARLEAARAGARVLPKARTGDVIGLPAAPGSPEVVVVQVRTGGRW